MNIKSWSLPKVLPYLLIIVGIVGFASAAMITYDKMLILEDPSYKPSCDLNPVISCGSVMMSDQANAFGFMNPFIGLAAYPMLVAIGLAMLAGAKFKRWYWLGINAGLFFALAFVHWLFFQTVYRINSLCPYCIAVWAVTISSFWYVTLYNIDQKNFSLPQRLQKIYPWIRRHHLDILVVWFLIIFALIMQHFWYYYGRNF